MTIKKKGGYSGGKPASSMGPPPRTPSATIRPKTFSNNEFFKIGGDRTVTVSVTFDVDPKVSEATLLKNAAEAIKFYAENTAHKSWARRIEVK
jgi:hypothetical protein